jgi:hypothetical protein
MTTEHMAAFACFALGALYIFAFSFEYLTCTKFMPYHREVVGKSWAEIDARLQRLILGMMRAVGGCAFAVGLAFTVILAIPYREGQPWAAFALALIGTVAGATAFFAMYYAKKGTPARPPMLGPIAGILLSILGLILSIY